ncbi:glycosyltransferase family 9 protein [bacterium SCSIO 12643]|nr:glycosyltransferase family 9 protein [bacterium SCSIO 12643]
MTIVPNKILIIQTAFIGDVILATALIEKIRAHLPKAQIDYLVRKGNEALVQNHPHINEVIIWDKKSGKYKNLYRLLKQIRNSEYDAIVNTQRFGATGMLTALSKAKIRSGFSKNPFSIGFTHSAPHEIGDGTHEVERNQKLISFFTDDIAAKPRLYPSKEDFDTVSQYQSLPYITISPTSVWFTKQYPAYKWVELIDQIPENLNVFLLGGPDDKEVIDQLIAKCQLNIPENLAGQLSFLQSAALMKSARMNYVNDSGPLHLCSAMNAPVTSVFCSTIPDFGFTPLSDNKHVIETASKLDCRPCGLHGHKSCPENHFECANTVETRQLLSTLE